MSNPELVSGIHLRDVPVAGSRDVEEGVTFDFDANGNIFNLEALDASERLGLSSLVNVSIENLPVESLPPTTAQPCKLILLLDFLGRQA